MAKRPFHGKFSKKHPVICPNCGEHYTKCPCWQEYVETQLPLSNQGDDMYAERPLPGDPLTGLISPDEVIRAERKEEPKRRGLFG